MFGSCAVRVFGVWSLALIGNASAGQFAFGKKPIRGVFDKETRRKPLAFAADAVPNIEVKNVSVRNSTHWLGMIENPTKAHRDYARDKRAIEEMLKEGSGGEK
jgi:hypothetical protein